MGKRLAKKSVEETAAELMAEVHELFGSDPELYLAPKIHRRAQVVFEWWLQKYPEINNGHNWLRPVICSSEGVERIREQCWFDDLFQFLVPLGLLMSRSVVELSTTVKPYSMRIVIDWSNKAWREATREALVDNNLLPDSWPDFYRVKANIRHYGIRHTSILGIALHKEMQAAATIAAAVQQLVESSPRIGFKNNILYAEIEGIRVLGPVNIIDTFPPIDGPLLPTPYVKPGHLQAREKKDAPWLTEIWLDPRSVDRLMKETGLSRTTINDAVNGTIPGGAKRENDKPRGDILLKPEGLDYLIRKGGKKK